MPAFVQSCFAWSIASGVTSCPPPQPLTPPPTARMPSIAKQRNRDRSGNRLILKSLTAGGLECEDQVRSIQRDAGQLGHPDQIEVVAVVERPRGNRRAAPDRSWQSVPDASCQTIDRLA